MNRQKISNIPLADFRRFLKDVGCAQGNGRGGHEKWEREGLTRPIVIQTHIDPVPMLVINTTLRTLGISKKQFFEYYYKMGKK